MSMRDGGPAFPVPGGQLERTPGAGGMSLREYFAAHAPTTPDWFGYTEPNAPVSPQHRDFGIEDGEWGYARALADGELDEEGLDGLNPPFPPAARERLVAFAKAMWDYRKKSRDFHDLEAMNRVVAWRWAYADAMLAAPAAKPDPLQADPFKTLKHEDDARAADVDRGSYERAAESLLKALGIVRRGYGGLMDTTTEKIIADAIAEAKAAGVRS